MNKLAPDTQMAGCLESSVTSEACADEIGQRIVRAYIRLVFAEKSSGVRKVTVTRMGHFEIHLIEALENDVDPIMPPFRLEVISLQRQTAIDSYDMSDFDDVEMTAAVEFIVGAVRRSENQGLTFDKPLSR